jgi:septum formation protein
VDEGLVVGCDSVSEFDGTVHGKPGSAEALKVDGLGGWFVESMDGDLGTLRGLSLPTLRRLPADLDIALPELWTQGSAENRPGERVGDVRRG